MLDLAFIREHPDLIKEVARRRKTAVDVDALLAIDSELRTVRRQAEEQRAEQNRLSKAIQQAGSDKEAREGFIQQGRAGLVAGRIRRIERELGQEFLARAIAARDLFELHQIGAARLGILVDAIEMRLVPKPHALEIGRPFRIAQVLHRADESGPPLRDEDYLILSTIHSAKGQEWKSVFVLNVVDGCIPSDLGTGTTQDLEEERRLLYVAMTRARDHLDLVVPQRFYVHQQAARGDRHVYAGRTRFVPPSILDRFEACSWPLPDVRGQPGQTRPFTPVDLSARMRGMWR